MDKVTYLAVFESSADGYGVYFPDLPGCISHGKDFAESISHAREALGLHLWAMEQDGDEKPEPTQPPFEDMPDGAVVVPITEYMSLVRDEMMSKAVRTNVSLPYWLKQAADEQNLNYSALLQAAIRNVLNIETGTGR